MVSLLLSPPYLWSQGTQAQTSGEGAPRLPTRPACVPLAWAGPLLVGLILTISLPPWRPLQAPTECPQCTVKASYSQCPPPSSGLHRQAQVTNERLMVGGGVSCQAPQAGAFATAPQLLSSCALSSARHVPSAPLLLTRPPASLQEVVLLPAPQQFLLRPGGGLALLPQQGKPSTRTFTPTHACAHTLSPHTFTPTHACAQCARPRVGGSVKHSVPLLPSPG